MESSSANISNGIFNEDTETVKQNHKKSKILLPLLLTMYFIGPAVLFLGFSFGSYFFTTLNYLSREEEAIGRSAYNVKTIKKDIIRGKMTIQLDDMVFDYVCRISYSNGGVPSYRVGCSYNDEIGERIFYKNRGYIDKLLIKYEDVLAPYHSYSDGENEFMVYDEYGLKSFFSDLMKNADYNKAYNSFLNSRDNDGRLTNFSYSLDYIIVHLPSNDSFMGDPLFMWADTEAHLPSP